MVDAISNFVLATTFLNQGPVALGEMVDAQSELSANDEEARNLLMVVSGFAARLNLADLAMLGRGRKGNSDIHASIRGFASAVTKQSGRDRSYGIGKIAKELARLPKTRLVELRAQQNAAGLSLFAPEQTKAKVRVALGAAPAVASATDDFSDDPDVGDRALLEKIIIRALYEAITNGNLDERVKKSFSRLFVKAVSGNGSAALYIFFLTDQIRHFRLRNKPPPKNYNLFQQGHVWAMQKALGQLDKEGSAYQNLEKALSNLRNIRPDLFH